MDPPITAVTNSSFSEEWEVLQGELNKLANSVPCSAMSMYRAIYKISSSRDSSYAVRLHWCIGKFFYALAVGLRENMEGDGWIEYYARSFVLYERVVDSLDALGVHLNDAVSSNKECRRISELGYVIWERCILRHRYEKRLPPLYESIRGSRQYADVCLRSLRRIKPTPGDDLDYYRNEYEYGLLAGVVKEFKQTIRGLRKCGFLEHLRECSIEVGRKRREVLPLFLEESHQRVCSELEKCILASDRAGMKSDFLRILERKVPQEAEELYQSICTMSGLLFDLFKAALAEYFRQRFSFSEEEPAVEKFRKFIEVRKECGEMLASFGDPSLGHILEEAFSKALNFPGVGESLAFYMSAIIKGSLPIEDFGALSGAIAAKDEKSAFIKMYLQLLMERLLSLNLNLNREKAACKDVDGTSEFRRKTSRIFDDVIKGARQNERMTLHCNENKLCFSGEGASGAGKFEEKKGKRFVYSMGSESVFVYSSVATVCVWPVPEEPQPNMNVCGSIREWADTFEENYKEVYKRRNLSWIWMLSTVCVEFTTNRAYCIKMSLYQYEIFRRLVEPRTEEELVADSGVGAKEVRNTLLVLQGYSLVAKEEGGYCINRNFASAAQRMVLSSRAADAEQTREGNRKPYYQAWISKTLKRLKNVKPCELADMIVSEHTRSFSPELHMYKEALETLLERGFIEEYQGSLHYVP